MEYLMTYGWAILIIAVALGALYQLGVFGSSGNSLAASCLATPGFLCQTPIINTSGYLAVKFGQIGISTLTITAVGCTANTTLPTSTQSVNLQLTSGSTAAIAFSCPLQSSAIGSKFSGYLWLVYSTPTQSGIIDRVASVSGKVSTAGGSIAALGAGGQSAGGNFIPPKIVHYVPITITNNQNSATGAGFDQLIKVNSNTYSTYEASDLKNVEFFGIDGTILSSWLESNNTNGATKTLYWVKLPSSIAASSNTVIYMGFAPTSNNLFDGVTVGEAPQLSASYAQYDDGANVFDFYDNFQGTSLSAKWSTVLGVDYSPASYAVNNGLTLTVASSSTKDIAVYTTSKYTPAIMEAYVSSMSAFATEYSWMYSVSVPASSNWNFMEHLYYSYFQWHILEQISGGSSGYLESPNNYGADPPGIFGITWPSTGTEAAIYNSGNVLYDSNTILASSQAYITLYATSPGAPETTSTETTTWVRQRSYPPSGVMPSVSFGSVV